MEKISTGSEYLNKFLNSGYEKGRISVIFGPAATGKTTLCMLAALATAKSGKKILFIDTENGFSVERLKQMSKDYEKILKK